MNMINKNLLAVSIAATLAAAPLANAAWTTKIAAVKNVVSQAAATDKDDIAASTNIVYTVAAGQSLAPNDTIEITLTGGAVFDGTTGVTLQPSAGDVGAGATNASAPLTGGTAGSTSATWRVITTVAAGSTLTLNSNAAIFDVAGVVPGNNANIGITLKTSTGTVIGTANQLVKELAGDAYPFTGVNLTTTTVTSSTNTAQVATGYKFLEDNATDVLTDAVTINTQTNSAATSVPTQVVTAGKLLYTITGDFTGVASIAATGVNGADAAGAASVPAVAGGFAINAAKTAAYATNAANIAAGGALNINDLVLTLDGTTEQAARTFNIATQLLADTLWTAHQTQSSVTATVIARNGTFFTSNSTGGLNSLKITDQSGGLPVGGGDILYKAYDVAGAAVSAAAGAPALPTKVPSNGTVIVPGADLVANYPNAVRFDVTVNSADANISNVKKSADGVNLTTYRSGTGGSL